MKELDFSGNELTSEGAESVASCAAGKLHLEYMGLEDNEIDSEGAKAVRDGDTRGGRWRRSKTLKAPGYGGSDAVWQEIRVSRREVTGFLAALYFWSRIL